jgi:rod shape-determining protein MreD
MSRPLVGWGVVVLLVILHFILHVGLGIRSAAPDLLTVALLLGARDLRIGSAAGLGFFFGLLEDALSVLVFGASALTMTLLGILGAGTREIFMGDSRLFVVSYFFAGKWLRDLLHWTMMGEELRGPFVDQVLLQGFTGALYVAAIGVVAAAITGMSSDS